ncbi:MAG TPA: hypothetical protein VH519_02705 [Hyphomicrobiaceae bacterium]|jgi:hypothetical protein
MTTAMTATLYALGALGCAAVVVLSLWLVWQIAKMFGMWAVLLFTL